MQGSLRPDGLRLLRPAEGASDIEQAVGRVLGSLCAITSREGEGEEAAESAMLASWISQVRAQAVAAPCCACVQASKLASQRQAR